MRKQLCSLIVAVYLMSSSPSFAVLSNPLWMEELCQRVDCTETIDKAVILGSVGFTVILINFFVNLAHSLAHNKDATLDLSNPEQYNIGEDAYVKFECNSDHFTSTLMRKFQRRGTFFYSKLKNPLEEKYKSCKASLMLRTHSVPLCLTHNNGLTDMCSDI